MLIATHDGSLHADEVFAVAALGLLNDRVEVVRTRDRGALAGADLRVDVGFRNDARTGDFDHHQRGFDAARNNGVRYASFGLVWREFGARVCDDDQEVADTVDDTLVAPVDANDTGQQLTRSLIDGVRPMTVSGIIGAFNAHWDETLTPQQERERFDAAVALAREVLSREVASAASGRRSERVVREAIDAGIPEDIIDAEVIAAAMRVVGDLWEGGTITVADEHLATRVCTRAVMLQREAFRAERQRAGAPVLLFGMPGEQHILGLEMAASILRHAGYGVVMLGADVPLSVVPAVVERHRPAVVGLTATMPSAGTQLRAAVEAIRVHAPYTGVIAGGAGVPASISSLPGVAVCRHVGDTVELTDGLLHRAALN